MRISGVGIEQLAQLADALVVTRAANDVNGLPSQARCFGLIGTLGAGKTRFCQEIAAACGVDPAEVTSPTFTLLKSYSCSDRRDRAGCPQDLHHLDLYRVVDEAELWELGVEELWETPDAWVLMEWADRFADVLPVDTIWVRITDAAQSGGFREIDFQTSDARHRHWLRDVATELVKIGFTGTIALD